jgi:hypothetical protein
MKASVQSVARGTPGGQHPVLYDVHLGVLRREGDPVTWLHRAQCPLARHPVPLQQVPLANVYSPAVIADAQQDLRCLYADRSAGVANAIFICYHPLDLASWLDAGWQYAGEPSANWAAAERLAQSVVLLADYQQDEPRNMRCIIADPYRVRSLDVAEMTSDVRDAIISAFTQSMLE